MAPSSVHIVLIPPPGANDGRAAALPKNSITKARKDENKKEEALLLSCFRPFVLS
jgi:hypothetical protein